MYFGKNKFMKKGQKCISEKINWRKIAKKRAKMYFGKNKFQKCISEKIKMQKCISSKINFFVKIKVFSSKLNIFRKK